MFNITLRLVKRCTLIASVERETTISSAEISDHLIRSFHICDKLIQNVNHIFNFSCCPLKNKPGLHLCDTQSTMWALTFLNIKYLFSIKAHSRESDTHLYLNL